MNYQSKLESYIEHCTEAHLNPQPIRQIIYPSPQDIRKLTELITQMQLYR